MDANTARIDGVHWRGELHRLPGQRGLVICSAGAGALAGEGRGALLCRVLHDYGVSTLSVRPPVADVGSVSSATEAQWTVGFDEALAWVDVVGHFDRPAIGLLAEEEAAAAALRLAAEHAARVSAVVTCNAELARVLEQLGRVRAATLLIVAAHGPVEMDLHRDALARLRGERRLESIPGVSRLLDEPGAFETVAHLAGSWLRDHLATPVRH